MMIQSSEATIIADERERDGGFPVEQRIPYKPNKPNEHGIPVIRQFHKGSCVAASCQMFLCDNSIYRPNAFIRDTAEIDADNGSYVANVHNALRDLGLTIPYRFEPSLTLAELKAAIAGGNSAIVSLTISPGNFHAIVVYALEESLVCIRDPLGEPYKVMTVENFLRLWNGKSAIPM